MPRDALAQVAAVVLGLVLGSFLNVVRVRLPRGESLWWPPSHCLSCGRRIRIWENIPVLSYLMLRGRCRGCRQPISWLYPAVEILAAALLWLTVRHASSFPEAIVTGSFALALLAVLFIDLEWQIIPDAITLPGIVVGVLAGLWVGQGVGARLLGALVGGGGLLALAWLYRAATGTDGLGLGDVKLMAMVGAFLGWQGVVGVLLLGSLAGSLLGLALVLGGRAGRRTALPFGSFLAPAAWLVLFYGPRLWEAYRSLWGVGGG
jgi:leader peptidase (prepilin peptidase)/N-methyltransferase